MYCTHVATTLFLCNFEKMTKKEKILKLQKYVEYSHSSIVLTFPPVHFLIPLSLVAAKFQNYQKYVLLVTLNKVGRKCCLVDFYPGGESDLEATCK